MIIFREFSFDAAHFLPNVPEDHKCREIHGHTYRLKLYLEGPLDPVAGWVLDFAVLKREVNNVLSMVDHKMLNKVPGLENPTCELLCIWLWDELKKRLPLVSRVELYENLSSGAIYEGKP